MADARKETHVIDGVLSFWTFFLLHSCSAVDIASVVNVARSDISVSEEALYGGCKVAQDRENPQLVTSVHACGVLSDAIIRNQTVGTLRKTTAPKISSILHSSPACVDAISHCLTFSSIATLLGSPGQSNYAAANGALDAWSTALRDEGSPVVSIQWGAWHGAGMGGMAASNPGRVLSKLTQLGFGLLTPEVGIRALRDIMDEIEMCGPVVMVSPFDPARLLKSSSLDSAISPILKSIVSITNSREDIQIEQPDLSCVGRIQSKAPEVREIALKAASEILMKRPQSDESLVHAGLDSLSAIEFRDSLSSSLGISLPGTLIFDHPTIDAITSYVSSMIVERVESKRHLDSDKHNRGRKQRRSDLHPQLSDHHPRAQTLDNVVLAKQQIMSLIESNLGFRPDDKQPLIDAGLDSLSAIELRDMLSNEFGIQMPATVVFDYPCVSDLAEKVVSLSTKGKHAEHHISKTECDMHLHLENDTDLRPKLSVVAVASSFPGLSNSRDKISRTPIEHWDARDSNDGRAAPAFGAFLSGLESFDAVCFDISMSELALLDAQQRMLLVLSSESLRESDLSTEERQATGVYVGISSMDHQTLLNRRNVPISPFTATGGALSVAAGRLSFVHGLSGAAVAIDTACSSSLVALQVAMSATVNNSLSTSDNAEFIECVASVNLLQVAETTMMFQRAGMIALDGRCKTLDSQADGYTRGEACASIVLFDTDYLLSARNTSVNSIVLGTSVNQDGRSSTLTAPNGPAQQVVMRRSLAQGRISARDICYVQLHGTGTPLGDPIEIGALSSVFDTPGPGISAVILGAPKSSIGHGEPASGISSLIQAIVSLRRESAPAVLHLSKLNHHIITIQNARPVELAKLASRRQLSTVETSRLSSISAFAFQGTNAHAILQDEKTDDAFDYEKSSFQVWNSEKLVFHVAAHPMLSQVSSKDSVNFRFLASISATASQSYLFDHQVNGRALFPAAGMLELGSAAARSGASSCSSVLYAVGIFAPVILDNDAMSSIVTCDIDICQGSIQIGSNSRPGCNAKGSCGPHSTCHLSKPSANWPDRLLGFPLASCSSREAVIGRLESAANWKSVFGGENDAPWTPPPSLDAAFQLGFARRNKSNSLQLDTFVPVAMNVYVPPIHNSRVAGDLAVAASSSNCESEISNEKLSLPRSDHYIIPDKRDATLVLTLLGLQLRKIAGTRSPKLTAHQDSCDSRSHCQMMPLYATEHLSTALRANVVVTDNSRNPIFSLFRDSTRSLGRETVKLSITGLETVQNVAPALSLSIKADLLFGNLVQAGVLGVFRGTVDELSKEMLRFSQVREIFTTCKTVGALTVRKTLMVQ